MRASAVGRGRAAASNHDISDWAQAAWATVREAQADAIAAARVGTPARDVDAAQRRIVESRPDLGRCLHGAGHAIGAEVHEPPFLIPRTTAPLEAGTCVTIEPGLYRAGVGGIRLEDQVALAERVLILTHTNVGYGDHPLQTHFPSSAAPVGAAVSPAPRMPAWKTSGRCG